MNARRSGCRINLSEAAQSEELRGAGSVPVRMAKPLPSLGCGCSALPHQIFGSSAWSAPSNMATVLSADEPHEVSAWADFIGLSAACAG